MFETIHRALRRARTPGTLGLAVVVGIVMASIGGAGVASAHTGFESSDPGDGAVVGAPVDVVTISFTGEATPVGDQFVALNAAGELQEPVEVTTDDNRRFVVRFDPPLTGGTVGIRWNVQAADAHPIKGAFSFTVDAPAPAEAASASGDSADDVVAADPSEVVGVPGEGSDAAPAPSDETMSTSDPVMDMGATAPEMPEGTAAVDDSAEAVSSLDEFLAVDSSVPGETTATVGRVTGLVGVAVGLGMLMFVATTLRGRRDEVWSMLTAVRGLGLVIAVGAVIEYVGVTRIAGDALADGWSTAPGFATVLRFGGGLALAFGVAGSLVRVRPRGVAQSLSAMVLDERVEHRPVVTPVVVRWRPDERSWAAAAGAIVVIASFWFDGHTVSKGFRPLHAVVNSLHLAAGSVWVGGVVSIAVVLWMRTRNAEPLRATEMVVRFSKTATVSLAGVVIAGGIMAFLVLDSFSELTGTEWGRILLLKTAAVGLAMSAGAYNHFRLLPALETDPESHELQAELRGIVTAEAIVLLFVVMVTGWLVAAAS